MNFWIPLFYDPRDVMCSHELKKDKHINTNFTPPQPPKIRHFVVESIFKFVRTELATQTVVLPEKLTL
jgi:hypothetical protein